MKILNVANYEEMSSEAARLVEQEIQRRSNPVLGLATGSTPLGLYRELIEGFNSRGISYRNVRTVNLDEYRGLAKNHPNSYYQFMNKNLFHHLDIREENTYIPDGLARPVEAECRRYEALIDEIGPAHLQILGIGTNGHIGFNEPGTPEDSLTHCVSLAESTRKNNARFFDSPEQVPTHAITMGIASILKSDKIVLLASGTRKAQAVKTLLEGTIDTGFPASFLRKHPDVTLIADQEAFHLAKAEGK
ncbi:glucosamine-6-phosphate deaminase [Planococcus lenghuensis]|uniref:Glucosamine-6-phosphate deaminase n=1 Tax=Planococcus lenghuensis TaxID=2213202 RepID=A0A1Q2L483_9BACL|nr:glucosamine-6-phosphate deaminase [Planococcus lenghuensis]AQQ55236.1 glucosamine-6-phosphate deaminase [Planococcus lenghuensis]